MRVWLRRVAEVPSNKALRTAVVFVEVVVKTVRGGHCLDLRFAEPANRAKAQGRVDLIVR